MAPKIAIKLSISRMSPQEQPNKIELQDSPQQWAVSVVINGKLTDIAKTLEDPFLKQQGGEEQPQDQEEECRWYVERYAIRYPFARAKAGKAAEQLQNYATSLLSDLGLPQLVKNELKPGCKGTPTITIAISEDSSTNNSVHRLHWELLEDPTFWNLEGEIIVKRVVDTRDVTESQPVCEVELDDKHTAKASTVNGLVVVARDLSESQDKVDISPNFALGVLAKIQEDLNSHSDQARLHLEVVRPGTLEALEDHLQRAMAVHGKACYHFIHFDLHGKVDNRKRAAYLLFNSTDPAKYQRVEVPASNVAAIMAAHGISVVVLNACESAKANSGDVANVAKTFVDSGVQNVLAMSYKLSSSAAEPFLRGLYHSLFLEECTLAHAARNAREILRKNPERNARFSLKRSVCDYFIPVLYTLGQDVKFVSRQKQSILGTFSLFNFAMRWGKFKRDDVERLVGRDFDVLRLEKHLIAYDRVHLVGRAGVGKTAMLHYVSKIWRQTSFVDAVAIIDISKTKTLSDLINSFISQIDTAPKSLASELSSILHSRDFSDASFSALISKACPQQRLAIVLDGVPNDQATNSFSTLGNTQAVYRFIEALIKLRDAQNLTRIIVVSRLEGIAPPISKKLQDDLEKNRLTLPSLDLDNAVELSLLTLRRAGLDVDKWKEADDRECKLLVGLLDGNPSAILHTVPQMVRLGKPLRQFRRLVQVGIPPDGRVTESLVKEVEDVFRSFNDERRALFMLLSAFWTEAVPISYITNWVFTQGICKSMINTLAIPHLQGQGLIDFQRQTDKGGKINSDEIVISWIHPLLTIYGRRIAHETLTSKRGKPGKSQIWAATLICSIMGVKFKENMLSDGSRALRQSFFLWFIQGVATADRQRLGMALLEDLTFNKLVAFWPLEVGNLAVSISMALRTPMEFWPLDYFGFHVTNLRLVGRPEHLEHFTQRFEALLEKALEIHGGTVIPPAYLTFALTIVMSLAAIYLSEWPLPEKREKYVNLALQIIQDTEDNALGKSLPSPFKTGSRELYLKGLVHRHQVMQMLGRGDFEEALKACKQSLDIDKSFLKNMQAQGPNARVADSELDDARISELTDMLAVSDDAASAIKTRLEALSKNPMAIAFIKSRENIMEFLELAIAESKGEMLDPVRQRQRNVLLRKLGGKGGMKTINEAGNLMSLSNINVESG